MSEQRKKQQDVFDQIGIPKWAVMSAAGMVGVAGLTLLASRVFAISGPGHRLAISGIGVKGGLRVSTTGLAIPVFRQVKRFSVLPRVVEVEVVTLSNQTLHAKVPIAVTVIPDTRKGPERKAILLADRIHESKARKDLDRQAKENEKKNKNNTTTPNLNPNHESDPEEEKYQLVDTTETTEGHHHNEHDEKDGLLVFAENFAEQTTTKIRDSVTNKEIQTDLQAAAVITITTQVVRSHLAGMSFQDMQTNRPKYEKLILQAINRRVHLLGMEVITCGVQRLTDVDKHTFLENLEMRALKDAEREAQVAIADNDRKTQIAQKTNEATMRIAVAEEMKKAAVAESIAAEEVEKAKTKLELAKVQFSKQIKIADLSAKAETEEHNLALQREVELKRGAQLVEERRALDLTDAQVKADVLIKRTEGEKNALLTKTQAEVEAKKNQAEADRLVTILQAEAVARAVELESAAKLVAAKNELEARVVASDADKRKAEADLIVVKTQSEARLLAAKNDAAALRESSAAALFAAQHEAQGVLAKGQADAKQYSDHIEAAGSAEAYTQFHFTKTAQAEKVATAFALGLKDAKPNMTVIQSGENVAGALASVVGAVPSVLSSFKTLWPISINPPPSSSSS